jgi:hypothetical protein
MMSSPFPQFRFEGADEYAETFINQQPQLDRAEEDGSINVGAIARMEVRYCDRMPQLPQTVAFYTLEFGKNKIDSMRHYKVVFVDGTTKVYPAYPPSHESQLLVIVHGPRETSV